MKRLSDHIRQLLQRYFPLQRKARSVRRSFRQGLASRRMGVAKTHLEVPLKKSVPAIFMLRSFAQTRQFKACCCFALLALAGCMATQNRWQATQMRQQVMDYYNDQIMENLIRTNEKLPFVHVDVTSLTATDAASFAGTIGSGETPSFSKTSPAGAPIAGVSHALHTIARGVTRPFSYSVTPTRNTSVQIIASPAFGEVAPISTPTPKPTPTAPPTGPALMLSPRPGSTLTSFTVTFRWSSGSATAYKISVGSAINGDDIYKGDQVNVLSATVNKIPIDGRTIYVTLKSTVNGLLQSKSYKYTAAAFQPSKVTQTIGEDANTITETETELTAKPVPTPKPTTVYDLYEGFLHDHSEAFASNGSTAPRTGYVPGTIKRWGSISRPEYYYIRNDKQSKEAYYNLCKALFTKGKAQSIEAKVEQISQREGEAAAERAFITR